MEYLEMKKKSTLIILLILIVGTAVNCKNESSDKVYLNQAIQYKEVIDSLLSLSEYKLVRNRIILKYLEVQCEEMKDLLGLYGKDKHTTELNQYVNNLIVSLSYFDENRTDSIIEKRNLYGNHIRFDRLWKLAGELSLPDARLDTVFNQYLYNRIEQQFLKQWEQKDVWLDTAVNGFRIGVFYDSLVGEGDHMYFLLLAQNISGKRRFIVVNAFEDSHDIIRKGGISKIASARGCSFEPVPFPGFDNTQRDGYLRLATVQPGKTAVLESYHISSHPEATDKRSMHYPGYYSSCDKSRVYKHLPKGTYFINLYFTVKQSFPLGSGLIVDSELLIYQNELWTGKIKIDSLKVRIE
ncbi:MAG: hypothetical protein ACOCW1_01070 [Chitinispirillaceae bacterium]